MPNCEGLKWWLSKLPERRQAGPSGIATLDGLVTAAGAAVERLS